MDGNGNYSTGMRRNGNSKSNSTIGKQNLFGIRSGLPDDLVPSQSLQSFHHLLTNVSFPSIVSRSPPCCLFVYRTSDLPDHGAGPPSPKYIRGWFLWLERKINTDISTIPTLNFMGGEKCEIWPRFSIAVAFETLFETEQCICSLKQKKLFSVDDWPICTSQVWHNSATIPDFALLPPMKMG